MVHSQQSHNRELGMMLLRVQRERLALTDAFMALRSENSVAAQTIEILLLQTMRLRRARDAARHAAAEYIPQSRRTAPTGR